MFGYPVRLLPYTEWQQRLAVEANSPHHALHRLRSFFLRPQTVPAHCAERSERSERFERPNDSNDPNDLTVPELYQEGRRSAVRGDLTRQASRRV